LGPDHPNLVVQLAVRVGKSRASPIYPFFYHLYEHKELLLPEEEKNWKIQEAMMKYGESGSSMKMDPDPDPITRPRMKKKKTNARYC
jgi:hypothetical protein